MNLDLGLEGTVVAITGAGGQIGSVIVEAFLAAGCYVGGIDINEEKFKTSHDRLVWVPADTTNEKAMTAAWLLITLKFRLGPPTICVAAAALDLSFVPHHRSIIDMPVEQFERTLRVNTVGTFITAKTWLSFIRQGVNDSGFDATSWHNIALIVVGSEAGVFGVPGNPDYAASKSAVQYGLVSSLAPDAVRVFERARVNAIAPGAVDTPQFRKECAESSSGKGQWIESQATVASRKAVSMEHVAKMCLMLASDNWSGSVNGQVVRVDSGKSGAMFWDQNGVPTWSG